MTKHVKSKGRPEEETFNLLPKTLKLSLLLTWMVTETPLPRLPIFDK
jgi:hypothetical protein